MNIRTLENIFSDNDKKFFKTLKDILDSIESYKKKELYLYGGYIRDKILARNSKDIDMMLTEDVCEEFVDKLKGLSNYDEGFKCREHFLQEHPKSGYKLYTFRFKNLNLNLAIVEMKKSLKEEINSNEFTFNALCFDIVKNEFANIHDTIQFLYDIESKRIKCLLDPKTTFFLSPSRIFRLLRFYLSLNFSISKKITKYLRYNNSFIKEVFYNNSLWNQLKKLVRVMKYYPEKVYRIFKYFYAFHILDKIPIYVDFEYKRVIILTNIITKNGHLIDTQEAFFLVDNKLILPYQDYLTIDIDNLRILNNIHLLIIESKKNSYFEILDLESDF